MEINTARLIQMSITVLDGFKRIEPRDWGVEGTLLELGTEIGSLGRALTIWENYRHGYKSRHQLADELSDILFVLIKLIDDMNITVKDSLTLKRIESSEQAFFRLLELTTEIRQETTNETVNMKVVLENIENMISIVGGLAEYYQISLEKSHLEEMKFASLWQRLFFTSEGKRITHFVFLRKLIWKFATWRHQKKLDN